MSSKEAFDLFAALIAEHLPLDVDVSKTSDDARLNFQGMMAIAEQLKAARRDLKDAFEDLKEQLAEALDDLVEQLKEARTKFTDADVEEMAREAINELDQSDDDCRDPDPCDWDGDENAAEEGGGDAR